MARLLFYRGGQLLIEYRLQPGRTTIGRSDTSDVALPGEEISRTHALIDGRGDRWEIVDRSRHGTRLDGAPIKRAELRDGARLEMGPYTVEVRLHGDPAAESTADVVPERGHELVLATGEGGLHVERAVLTVVAGPDAGERHELRSSRVTVGGRGSQIALGDDSLVRDHCVLRVARGRVMVEPGAGPTFLDGACIRDVTPVRVGEEVVLGHTSLRVDVGQVDEAPTAQRFGDMVGDSEPMRKLFGTLRRVSAHHFPVLLLGESGTGKELAARGVHLHSSRATGPFVPVNVNAIPDTLFESELFGYEKGAFTGANKRTDGAFQRAHQGTLFLDEIGELDESAQSKLLRTLETGEVRRVGGAEVSYPDVRIVAATNRDLAQDVQQGTFREDLYFRLAVLSVHLPPLRARMSDLESICATLCRGLHPEAQVTPAGLAVLNTYAWPGNVRELRNVLTRAYVLGGPRIGPEHLTFHAAGSASRVGAFAPEEIEKRLLVDALRRHGENRSAAAKDLGIPRTTLMYRLKKYGLG